MKKRMTSRAGIRTIMAKLHRLPENRIVALADSGELRKIAEEAISNSKQRGLSVTIVEHGVMYRVSPRGERKKIKEVQPALAKYRKGQVFHIKAAS